MDTDFKHKDITEKIIKGAFTVANTLGFGFVERVYENALVIELEVLGLSAKRQVPIQVSYKGQIVGDYVADLIWKTRS